MTKNEENVIRWAFNLVHATVAGDYHLPGPMTRALNLIQDAVFELASERGISIKDGCSSEFVKYKKEYYDGVDRKIRSFLDSE